MKKAIKKKKEEEAAKYEEQKTRIGRIAGMEDRMAIEDETEATPRPRQVRPARQLRRSETLLIIGGDEDITESTPSGDDVDYYEQTEGSIGDMDTVTEDSDTDRDVEELLRPKKKAKKVSIRADVNAARKVLKDSRKDVAAVVQVGDFIII